MNVVSFIERVRSHALAAQLYFASMNGAENSEVDSGGCKPSAQWSPLRVIAAWAKLPKGFRHLWVEYAQRVLDYAEPSGFDFDARCSHEREQRVPIVGWGVDRGRPIDSLAVRNKKYGRAEWCPGCGALFVDGICYHSRLVMAPDQPQELP